MIPPNNQGIGDLGLIGGGNEQPGANAPPQGGGRAGSLGNAGWRGPPTAGTGGGGRDGMSSGGSSRSYGMATGGGGFGGLGELLGAILDPGGFLGGGIGGNGIGGVLGGINPFNPAGINFLPGGGNGGPPGQPPPDNVGVSQGPGLQMAMSAPPMRVAPNYVPPPVAGRAPPMAAAPTNTQTGMMQGGFGGGRFGSQFVVPQGGAPTAPGTDWKATGQAAPPQGYQQTGANTWRRG